MSTTAAFHFPAPGPCVLLIHGYTGSPYDVRPLGEYLHRQGCHVVGVRLRGHGTQVSDLENVVAEDWIADAEQGLAHFGPEAPINIVGLSMGGLLAILLAARPRRVKNLVLVSPSLRFGLVAEMIITAGRLGVFPPATVFPKFSGGSDIADPVAKKNCPSYLEMPLKGLLECDRLRTMALNSLALLTAPLLVAFGKYDSTVDAGGVRTILRRDVDGEIIFKEYRRSKHVLTLDYDHEQLFDDIWQFLSAGSNS
jgi:carboxylesterase